MRQRRVDVCITSYAAPGSCVTGSVALVRAKLPRMVDLLLNDDTLRRVEVAHVHDVG